MTHDLELEHLMQYHNLYAQKCDLEHELSLREVSCTYWRDLSHKAQAQASQHEIEFANLSHELLCIKHQLHLLERRLPSQHLEIEYSTSLANHEEVQM